MRQRIVAGLLAAILCCTWPSPVAAFIILPPDGDFFTDWTVTNTVDKTPNIPGVPTFSAVSFGITLLGQSNANTFNTTKYLAFLKARMPTATLRVEGGGTGLYARHFSVAVRTQARFLNAATSAADAQKAYTLLLNDTALAAAFPAPAWRPQLEFVTEPYLANSVGAGVGVKGSASVSTSLFFTMKFAGMVPQFGFDPDRYEQIIVKSMAASIKAGNIPRVTFTLSDEVIKIGKKTFTNIHVHTRVAGVAPLSDLEFFAGYVKALPERVFNNTDFSYGSASVEPWSARIAYATYRPAVVTETQWNDRTRKKAERLALYSAAIRCKWPRVKAWTCVDCRFGGTKLLDSWVSSATYEDAKDAFMVHYDSVLNALVVTFRSTYGNKDGWLNALKIFQVQRTLSGNPVIMHEGFSAAFYGCNRLLDGDLCVRAGVVEKLKLPIKTYPELPIYFVGHSRGGAMATMAAVEVAAFQATILGIPYPKQQVKLYTFGQPRVGDSAYVALVHKNVGERFRIVSNADPAPNMPPNLGDLSDLSYVLPQLAEHGVDVFLDQTPFTTQAIIKVAERVIFALAGIPPQFEFEDVLQGVIVAAAAKYRSYTHWGPQVLSLHYYNTAGGARTTIKKEVVCASYDNDRTCDVERAKAVRKSASRPTTVPTYNFGTMGSLMNRWPLFAALDHGWYLGVDVGNEDGVAMKPPGWFGWKLTVGTADVVLAGTDGDIRAAWKCTSPAASPAGSMKDMTFKVTAAAAPELECGISVGEFLGGNFDDINCFERGDVDMFSYEYIEGAYQEKNYLVKGQDPRPVCTAPGARLSAEILLDSVEDWEPGSLSLEMAYTEGPDDKIKTKTFGRCPSTPLPSKPPLVVDGIIKGFSLCEAKPWYRWTIKIKTRDAVFAGTDAPIDVMWWCGKQAATTRRVPVQAICENRGDVRCFESGDWETFVFEYDPGRLYGSKSPYVTGNTFPLPACLDGSKPVLSVGFLGRIDSASDNWQMEGTELNLEYLTEDVTSTWDFKAGNRLSVTKKKVWKRCSDSKPVQWWTGNGRWQYRNFTMCA